MPTRAGSGAVNGPRPAVALTEWILARLPGAWLFWVLTWALVPWLNLAVIVALGAGQWTGTGVPAAEVLNRTAVTFAVALSLWGVARISDQLRSLRPAVANLVDHDEPDVRRLFRGIESTLAPLLLTAATAVILPVDEAVRGEPVAVALFWARLGFS